MQGFSIKPDCTYNKWILKSLAIALVTFMYYTLQYEGVLRFEKQFFPSVMYDSLNKHQLHHQRTLANRST
jgi:hypothetical protein